MADPFRKVRPGEPFVPSAKLTNALVDLLSPNLSTLGGAVTLTKSQTVLSVKNSSGADRNRMEVLALGTPWITPAENIDEFATKPSFESVLPDSEEHLDRFVVLLEPIADGESGRAAIAGAVPALILKPEGDDPPAAVDVLGYSPEQVGALAFLHPNPTGGAQVLWIEPDDDATAWEGDPELGTLWEGYKLHRALVRFGRGASGGAALFEMKETLREGGSDAIGWKVQPLTGHFPGANDAGGLVTYTISSRILWGTAPTNVLPTFRGIAYGKDDVDQLLDCSPEDGRAGDLVLGIEIDGTWYAVGNGRIHGRAVVQGLATDESVGPGGTVVVGLVDENRVIQCLGDPPDTERVEFLETATIHCGTAKNGSRLELWWDHQTSPPAWKADVCPKPPPPDDKPPGDDDEDEDGDDDSGDGGDGVGSPGGDGSDGNCSACSGLPDGEKCLPTECCSDEETAPVTDCEHANPAYDKYRFEIEGTVCLPQSVKDAATVEHTEGCTWESTVVTADDPLTGEEADWKWVFEPVADGTSWLRLYKDGEVYLQFFRAGPWCYRCAQVFEIFCPPSECSDISARICIRPICVDACEHSTTYEITSPGDEDAADSTVYIIGDDNDDNSATVTTTNDFGCPDPPARSTIFQYGYTSLAVDGAVAIDIFPETEYSPTTCGSELDFVNANVKAKVIFDDTIEQLGVKYGVAVEQDGDHFIAPMGDVYYEPEREGCTYLGRQHLKAEDFQLVNDGGFNPASHPDFSATAPNLKFGIARWVLDHADADDPAAPGHKAGTIYDDAHIQLCYAPCEGDPAEFDCPESVNLTACIDGENDTQTVTITNSGDNSFNITGWSRTSGLNPALNPDVVPFPLTIAADPPGTLAPGEEWEMTFTLTPGDEEWTGSGFVTIHTTIGDCTFPVSVAVLEDCDPEDACALFHDDQRDYEADPGPNQAAGTLLSQLVAANDFEPYNDGLLEYSDTLLECNSSTGATVTAEDVENETKAGGGARFNSSTNLTSARSVIQPMTPTAAAFPANFAAKAAIGLDTTSYTHAIGYAFGVVAANDWWGIAQSRFMADGPSSCAIVLLRQRPGELREVVERYSTDAGIAVVGIHVVGGRAKIVLQNGTSNAGTSLLDSGDVTYTFAEEPVLEGTGFGLLRHNGEADERGANNSYWGELCITDQPGIAPIWEIDPP